MVSEYLGDKKASNEFAQSDGGDKELQVQMNVSLMLSDDAMFEAFKQEFNDGKLDEMTTRLYVKALGGKHTGVIEAVKSLLESWIEQDSECRPYFFLTEKELLEEAKSRIERFKKDKRNRAQLIQVLVDHDRENGGTGGTLGMRPIDRLRLNLIKRVLQSSFLPKLYGKGKEYCKRGHDLEPVCARALRKDSEEGLTDVVFEEIYNLGMCRKRPEQSNDSMSDSSSGRDSAVLEEEKNLANMMKSSTDFIAATSQNLQRRFSEARASI